MRRLVWWAAARSPDLPASFELGDDRLAVLEVDVAAVLELCPDLVDDDTDCPYGAQLLLVSYERIGDLQTRLERRELVT